MTANRELYAPRRRWWGKTAGRGTDVDLLFVTDSAEEAAAHVRDIGLQRFGLTYEQRIRRLWFLGE